MTLPVTPAPAIFRAIVNMLKVGTIPNPFNPLAGGLSNNMKGAAINGDAVFFNSLTMNNNIDNPQGFYAIRIRPKVFAFGEYIYLPGGPDRTVTNYAGAGCQQVGPNQLQVFDAGTNGILQFTIPNAPTYGARVPVSNTFPSVPAPCGVGIILNTFYASQQNLIAYEFANTFSGAFDDYAAIYKATLNGQVVQNGGFVNHVLTGQRAFNQTSNNLPAEVTGGTSQVNSKSNVNFSNGWNSYWSMGVTGNWNAGAFETVIIQGGPALNCNTSVGNNLTYVTTTNAFNWTQAQLTANPNFGLQVNNPSFPGGSYCEVPGIFIGFLEVTFGSSGFGCVVYADGVLVQVSLPTSPSNGMQLSSLVLMSDGTLIGLSNNAAGGWDVYEGFFNLFQWRFLFPSFTIQAYSTLVNFARPISVNGSYLT